MDEKVYIEVLRDIYVLGHYKVLGVGKYYIKRSCIYGNLAKVVHGGQELTLKEGEHYRVLLN